MIAVSLFFISVILVVEATSNFKPVSKPTASPPTKTRVYKAVVDAQNRVTEIQVLTYFNGVFTRIGGEYSLFDDATEFGYFEGDIIPGSFNALVNYGGLIPEGDPWKQVWTPYIGAELYQYKVDSKNNVVGYTYYDKTNGDFQNPDLSNPTVVTFCTKTFKQCTGIEESSIYGAPYQNTVLVPTNPLALQNSVFTQVAGSNGAAPTGPNPVSFHWTGVGPYVGGALVGGYEYNNPGSALEIGYYLPNSIAVNAKDYLVVLSAFKAVTGINAGTHYGQLTYFVNGYYWDYYCSGKYNAAGKLILSDASTCGDDFYVASPKPDASIVKRLLGYIDKTVFKVIFSLFDK